MGAARIAYIIGTTFSVIAIGFGVPYFSLRAVITHAIPEWMGLIIAVAAILSSAILGIVCYATAATAFEELSSPQRERELEHKLKVYRARQRALLEEFDEIVSLLREMRDILKQAGGETYEGEASES